jgi:8-oxo-dGTP diphosphatase
MGEHKPVTPLLTVDCVLFEGDAVVLIRRKNEPFQGRYALPGGFVDLGESVEEACEREMKEETSIIVHNLRLIGVYSKPGRDPRGDTATVAFLGEGDTAPMKGEDDALEAKLVPNWREQKLAFDHDTIVRDAWALHSKIEAEGRSARTTTPTASSI